MSNERLINEILNGLPINPADPADPVYDRLTRLFLRGFHDPHFARDLVDAAVASGHEVNLGALADLIDDLWHINRRLEAELARYRAKVQ